jgi:hypothetical protein
VEILPTAVSVVIFFIVQGFFLSTHSKIITIEYEVGNVSVVEGERLEIKCDYLREINNSKKITKVQWTKESENETLFDSPNIISLNESQWLSFKNIEHSNQGRYACLISGSTENGLFSKWCNITLTTYKSTKLDVVKNTDDKDQDTEKGDDGEAVPRFTKISNMHRVITKPAGNMMRFKCSAEGNPTPNIMRYKNRQTPFRRSMDKINYSQWGMMFENLIVLDSGNYTYKVCNKNGCIDFTFKVDEIERFAHKPYIIEGQPHNVTALVYTNESFEYNPYADLELYINWYYHNASIVSVTEENSEKGIVKQNNGNPKVLQLFNVTYLDEGWYTCKASNNLNMTYASAYLKVISGYPVYKLKTFNYNLTK